ncbi:MAG: HdeD family acid-resistance protein [Methylocella sp.]
MIDSPATSPIPPLGGGLGAGLARTIGAHWKWYLAEGVILVILGLLAVLSPLIAGIFATLFIGWLFLFAGVAGLIFTYKQRAAPGFWWSLFSSAIAVLAGLSLAFSPVTGLISLTIILIAYFLIDGVLTILLGLEYRRDLSDRWVWVVISGVIDLILAALLISGFPGTAAWAIGLIVGIDLAFGGASIIGLALAARKAAA